MNRREITDGKAWCGFHQEWHPTEEFGNNSSTTTGLQRDCKRHRRNLAQIYNARNNPIHQLREIDNFWTIYELPEGHIGLTKSRNRRFRHHRSKYNRITEGWIPLDSCISIEDAKRTEAYFQSKSKNYDGPDSPKQLEEWYKHNEKK